MHTATQHGRLRTAASFVLALALTSSLPLAAFAQEAESEEEKSIAEQVQEVVEDLETREADLKELRKKIAQEEGTATATMLEKELVERRSRYRRGVSELVDLVVDGEDAGADVRTGPLPRDAGARTRFQGDSRRASRHERSGPRARRRDGRGEWRRSREGSQGRVDMTFGIGYSDDVSKAESVLAAILSSHEKVLDEPEPIVRLHELGDSSVNFVVRPWCKTEDYWDVYWDVTREVKHRFDEEGISIPFPQRDVHIYREDSGDTSSGGGETQRSTTPSTGQTVAPSDENSEGLGESGSASASAPLPVPVPRNLAAVDTRGRPI